MRVGTKPWARVFVLAIAMANVISAQEQQKQQTKTDASDPSPSAPVPARTEKEIAEAQVKAEEHQRILGIIPHFNVTDLNQAVRISAHQKFELAIKSSFDPFNVALAGVTSSIGQGLDSDPGYGLGAKGYFKRFGAGYADSVDGNLIGNALLPSIFHQDPRYLKRGTGSVPVRIAYAVLSTFRCKGDNGRWQINYSNLLGNFAAGGISNFYYPANERGLVNTYQRTIVVSAQGAFGAILAEFLPESTHMRRKHRKVPPGL